MHLVLSPTILNKLSFVLNLSWDNYNTQEGYPVFAGRGAGGGGVQDVLRVMWKWCIQ